MMGTLSRTCEIVEFGEDIESELKIDERGENSCMQKSGNKYTIEDDINRLFQAIEIKNVAKSLRKSRELGKNPVQKNALIKPLTSSSSQASGIGISEPVSLKQALRGLCISQASEVAALKRLAKQASSSRSSEAGTIKKLYNAVVVEANGSSLNMNEVKGNLVEFSLVPEISTSSEKRPHLVKMPKGEVSNLSSHNLGLAEATKSMTARLASRDQVVPFSEEIDGEKLMPGILNPSSNALLDKEVLEISSVSTTLGEVHVSSTTPDLGQQEKPQTVASLLTCTASSEREPCSNNQCLIKPIFRNKNFGKKKVKQALGSPSSFPTQSDRKTDDELVPCTSTSGRETHNFIMKPENKESMKQSPMSSSSNASIEVDSSTAGVGSCKAGMGLNSSKRIKFLVAKAYDKPKSKEKGEISQSSKSSIGDYSSSASISEDSNLSGSVRSGHRPHMSKDLRWEAVRSVQQQHGNISLRHFKLLRKLGCGDIGTVYLAELIGTNCLFALKVMDNEFLVTRKKMFRAQTEREILQVLDHPFLPTLYACFASERFSCLVMEYCPGGDLHVLRQKQPYRSFSEQAARFYVAEVLLALEYLHMLGVVYRDLKPENILLREDGHIMLTDFDLSLRCSVNPMLLKSSSPVAEPAKKMSSPCAEASCIHPFCLQPNWQVPCFTPIIISSGKSRKAKSDLAAQQSNLPQLVVEPTDARSNSFVGTHEYLAPEIIKGEGHGSAVDWWTFGVFLFELLYGKTPFKGAGNEDTLANVVSQSLKFPDAPIVSFHARDLIRGLLVKDPENRLGSAKGAADIKQHPFFEGLNWALIRCTVPPELPKFCDLGTLASQKESAANDLEDTEACDEFELF